MTRMIFRQSPPYRQPAPLALTAFVAQLRQGGVSVKVRKRKGSAIDAACGQLRRRVEEAEAVAAETVASPEPVESKLV